MLSRTEQGNSSRNQPVTYNIQLTLPKLSAWRKNHPGTPGASVWPEDQVLHRGRKPSRRRYQEVLLPFEQRVENKDIGPARRSRS